MQHHSFHNRISLTFAGLMLLTGGLSLVMEWLVLRRHSQDMLKHMAVWLHNQPVSTIEKIGRDLMYQTMTETGAVVLLVLLAGLAILGAMLRSFDERVHEQRREMLAYVSHELRTPLTSMQGYLETLLRKSDQLSATEQRQYLEVAVRQSRRAGGLAQGLFELAKLEAGDTLPIFEAFPLQELIQDIVQKYAITANAHGIQLVSDLLPGIPPVYADIGMIERVLSTLVNSALQHASKPGIIRLELNFDGGHVRVSIWNSGACMTETHLSPFFETTSPISQLFGNKPIELELLIVKRIIQLHESTIEIESKQKCGMAFMFRLRTACSS